MSIWTEEFKHPIDFLLQENGDHLLRENGDLFVLDQTGRNTSAWIIDPKN